MICLKVPKPYFNIRWIEFLLNGQYEKEDNYSKQTASHIHKYGHVCKLEKLLNLSFKSGLLLNRLQRNILRHVA